MPTFMSKSSFLTWLDLHEAGAAHFKEDKEPNNAKAFAQMIAENVEPAKFRQALMTARAADIPFALTPLSSIENQVAWTHSCRIDEKSTFKPSGTDSIWALTGLGDRTAAVSFGKGKEAIVDAAVPKGSALERAADPAAFKATKATGSNSETMTLNPLLPIPAILFKPLSENEDQLPKVLVGRH